MIDVDVHFSDHLAGLRFGPDKIRLIERGERTCLELAGREFPKPSGHGAGNPRGIQHLVDSGGPVERAAWTARHHISLSVLQPGFVGLALAGISDPRPRRRLLEAYNDAVRHEAHRGERAAWSLFLSQDDPTTSAALVRRYGDDERLVGITCRPTGRDPEARLSGSAMSSVLAAAAERELPLFLHGGTGCYQWSPLADAFSRYELTHALGHMGEHIVAVAELMVSLRLASPLEVVLLESGTAWLPLVLSRLERDRRALGGSSGGRGEPARVHVVPDPREPLASWACAALGPDRLLFGSDYPHWDVITPDEFFAAGLMSRRAAMENALRVMPRAARLLAGDPPPGRETTSRR